MTRSVSLVIPVFNEQENVLPLLDRILATLRPLGIPFEVIFADDGSHDDTVPRLRGRVASTPELVVLRLRHNVGQTAALQAGFDHARGSVIVTMDGDRQNDPADVPRLLERIELGADVVSGWRRRRHDRLFTRKLPSWVANGLIRAITGVPIHDQGCSLKAYRRDVVKQLSLYSDMHRFVGVLSMPLAGSIEELEVRHHARVAGHSKYGMSRALVVLVDLASVELLRRFRGSPGRAFLWLGAPFLAGSLIAWVAALWRWGESVVFPTVAVLLALFFVWCLFAGMFAQAVIGHTDPARLRRAGGVGP
jgi:glycosyltransferase involved in cell wall biosynthesis